MIMDEDLLKSMKTRIIHSFRWKKDVIIPLSDELDIPVNEFEEILMNKLDMSSLEALHSTYESYRPKCLMDKLNCDLKLCWFVDVLEIINNNDYNNLKSKLMTKIAKGEKYEDILKFGKKEVYELLKK
jgi:energy-converting hydrogenase A subunit M